MNEKPDAGLLAAVVAVPLVLVCCLGPVVLGSLLAGAAAGLGGLGAAEIIGIALAIGAAGYGLLRWRRASLARAGIAECCAPFGDAGDPPPRPEGAKPAPRR